jgi:iron complex outermembrane receptor protein
MKRRNIHGSSGLYRLGIEVTLAALPLVALAQSATVSSPVTSHTSADSLQLAPVVVTATKRATTVQTTPISILAVTGDQISSRGLVDLNSLAQSVPGLSMRDSGGPGETEFEMRGLNSAGGNTSVVGLYLDSVPLSGSASGQLGRTVIDPGLYDLERVEVLRGPQGTLYGSSSMGGTIRLIPTPPRLDTFEASGEEIVSDTTAGGSINHQENGMVNIPLGSTAALRVVGSFEDDSGWIKRAVLADGAVAVDAGSFPAVSRPTNFYTAPLQETVDGVNTTNNDTIRAELLWKPTDNLSITPMAMYSYSMQGGPPAVDVNGDPTNPQVPTVKAHYEPFDTPEPTYDTLSLGNLKAEYQAPGFSVTSETAFWHRNLQIFEDGEEEIAAAIGIPVYDAAAGGIGPSSPGPNGPGTEEQDATRQLSEELRFASTTPVFVPSVPGHFDWLAGYFYQDLHAQFNELGETPEATPILGGPDGLFLFQPQNILQNAVFGQATWDATSKFKVSVGFRHYHYGLGETFHEFGAFSVYGSEGNTIPYNEAASAAASGTIPSLTLNYDVSPDSMIYATVTKGFRIGGANQPVPIPLPGTSLFNNGAAISDECGLQAKLLNLPCNPNILLKAPQTFGNDWVWSYEAGEKSLFLDRRLIVDVSGYFEDWEHPEIATNLAGLGLTANGGDAHIYGLDLQLDGILGAGWSVQLNGGYTHAKFIQSSAITGFPAGTTMPDTPTVTASAILHWTQDLEDGLSLFGSLEEDYIGSRVDAPYGETITLENIDDLLVHLRAYSLVNLNLGIRGHATDRGDWSASLFVHNLTNNSVLLDPQPQIVLQDAAFSRYTLSQPLTVGLDISYQFE